MSNKLDTAILTFLKPVFDKYKRFPPRYVDYVSMEVHRDGTIIYYPDGEEE